MNARRIFAAAAIAIATGTGAACSGGGGSPTLADPGNDPPTVPEPEPTDTSGFVAPVMIP